VADEYAGNLLNLVEDMIAVKEAVPRTSQENA
jgi:hypothetical protein